jgi:hypothetical protein
MRLDLELPDDLVHYRAKERRGRGCSGRASRLIGTPVLPPSIHQRHDAPSVAVAGNLKGVHPAMAELLAGIK